MSNGTLQSGQVIAVTLASNANSVGSSFSITEGVFFVRGKFVKVKNETLILNQYNNLPNYRIGLIVNEKIITSYEDENLNDNSQGFNNYSSRGADRFRLSLSLYKKSLNDFNDDNFIELAIVTDGVLKSQKNINVQYTNLIDELAKRTYTESGDYYVTPFEVSCNDSLNDRLGNRGIFNNNQFPEKFVNSYGEDVYLQIVLHNRGYNFLYVPSIVGIHDADISNIQLWTKLRFEIVAMGNTVFLLIILS